MQGSCGSGSCFVGFGFLFSICMYVAPFSGSFSECSLSPKRRTSRIIAAERLATVAASVVNVTQGSVDGLGSVPGLSGNSLVSQIAKR